MTKALTLLTFLIVPVALSVAHAEQGDWYVAGSIVYTDDDGRRLIDDSIAGGQANVGYELTDVFDIEGIFGYSDIEGFPGQEHLDIGVNLLSHLNPDGAFSPYILFGLGYLGTETTTGSEENRPSASAGIGAIWQLGRSRFALRGEYRARWALERSNTLTDRIATVGLQVSFGDSRTVPDPEMIPDGDGDGVYDDDDLCLDTVPGVAVDATGCEIFIDTDLDGVIDRLDECPGTPRGIPVDETGCIGDTDGDGVRDDVDECPGTVSGAAIHPNGCERDDDNDGVLNHRDRCPDSTPGVTVDDDGCEVVDIVALQGVNFATGSDRLLSGAEAVLDDAVAWLLRHPNLLVEVAGHTDSDGNDQLNLGLSERRALTVRDYLIAGGVRPGNVTARGYGESEPVADNTTAEGKAENRRVELRILGRRQSR